MEKRNLRIHFSISNWLLNDIIEQLTVKKNDNRSILKKRAEGRKISFLFLSIIFSSVMLIVFLLAGCSDNRYIGSMLSTEDLDRYILTPDADTFCLSNGVDSKCVTLIPKTTNSGLPVIHIYPTRITYVFYHDGVPIMRADNLIDTTGSGTSSRGDGGDGTPPGGRTPGEGDGGGTPPGGGTPGDGGGGTPGDGGGGTPGDGGGGTPDDGGGGTPGDGDDDGGGNGTPPGDGDDGGGGTPPGSGDDTPGSTLPNTIRTHLLYNRSNPMDDGWIIWIYYPEDYNVPRDPLSDKGFTVHVNGEEYEDGVVQLSGPCDVNDDPENKYYIDGYQTDIYGFPCQDDGKRYAAQLFVNYEQPDFNLILTWTEEPYEGQTHSFTISEYVNKADYTDPLSDHKHTSQDESN
ncbi:hypothetical protein JT359_20705 [Candidatus Poribacteria bacterium]|nr:hypothetical protein [Candidatus Poribacteria bacterium]